MEQRTVHLFVLDTLADWETGFAIAGINNPEYQKNPGAYGVKTVGATRDPVRTMGGVTIVPEMAAGELEPEDSAMLIVPGGAVWDQGGDPVAMDTAKRFLDAGVPVAAICGATGGLARAGVLAGRRHTSNAREYLAYYAPEYGGEALYSDEPAVLDGDLITAGGVFPVDFARMIFERLGLYEPAVLDAWYRLYKHGDAAGFYALAAMAEGRAAEGAA
jgi:putative intracellular protease/amidase